MYRSGARHALRLGVVLAFVALAVGACGTPEEAKPRPLPDETRGLGPGTYRTEEFEPAFSFEVGEGWSNAQPEVYDLLVITRGDEGGDLGFANLEGARFYKPTDTGATYMTDVPKDVAGWFRGHPYLETQRTDPVKVGGRRHADRLRRRRPARWLRRRLRVGVRAPLEVQQRRASPRAV